MTSIEPPPDNDAHSLAEFAESMLIVGDDNFLSATEILGYFATGSQPTEAEIDDALAEVERRVREFGALYPFRVEERGVAFDRGGASPLYEALCLLSLKGTRLRLDQDYKRSDPIFDDISLRAFLALMGEGAKGVLFGWPPRGDRPSNFPDAVEWLAGRLGVALRTSDIPSNYLDDGVDVFVWKAFPDKRNGFPVMAAQNTIQLDFRKKPRDVVPSHWRDWIQISAAPSVGFAVPFAMADGDPWWHTVSSDVTSVLDRGRIMFALESQTPEAWDSWPELLLFVDREIAGIDELEDDAASIVTRRKSR